MAKVSNISLYIVAVSFLFVIRSQAQSLQSHYVKHYTIEDGLNQRIVKKIYRDSLGRFWIFSDDGVQFYNGHDFKMVEELKGLTHVSFDKINVLKDGNICMLGEECYVVVNTHSLDYSKYPVDENLSLFVSDGILFKYDNLKRMMSSEIDSFELAYNPKNICRNGEQTLIQDEKGNVDIYENNTLTKSSLLVDDFIGILNDTLIYTHESGIYFSAPPYQEFELRYPYKYAQLKKDKKGNALLALSNSKLRFSKIYLYTKNQIKDLSFVAKPKNTILDCYSEDFSQSILIGTYEGLIYQSYSEIINQYKSIKNQVQGEFGQVCWWSVYREPEEAIYFARESQGVFRLRKGKLDSLFPNEKYKEAFKSNFFAEYLKENDMLVSISLGQKNKLWLWDFEEDLSFIDVDFKPYTICAVSKTLILVGGTKVVNEESIAVIKLFDLKQKVFTSEQLYPEMGAMVRRIRRSKNQFIVSTKNGLFRYDITSDKCNFGCPTITKVFTGNIIDHLSINDVHLVGTFGQGLIAISNEASIKNLNSLTGLADDVVHTLGFDGENIWAHTNKGLSILDSAFNITANLRIEDGLSSHESNQHSFSTDGSHIYVGTINGLNQIDLHRGDLISDNYIVPEYISYNIDDFTYTQELKGNSFSLPYGIDSCFISYNNYSMHRSHFDHDHLFTNKVEVNGESIAFETDRIPIVLSSNRTHLSIVNGNNSLYELDIVRESFVQRYGLLSLLLSLVTLLVFSLFSLNLKRTKEKKQKEILELTSKLDMIRSLALRSQMNPHFVFNALGAIQYYIQKNEQDLADEYLTQFATLMRMYLDASKEQFITIKKELELLKHYIELEQMRFEDLFEVEYETTANTELDYKIPTMILQPIVENAINHGLRQREDSMGQLSIRFDQKGGVICVEVKDNGVGVVKANKLKSKSYKSRSTQIINEKIDLLNQMKVMDIGIETRESSLDPVYPGTTVLVTIVKLSESDVIND